MFVFGSVGGFRPSSMGTHTLQTGSVDALSGGSNMHQTLTIDPQISVSPYVLSIREELRDRSMKRLGRFGLGDLEAEVCRGREAVWCIVRRTGRGGLALRAAHTGGAEFTVRKVNPEPGEALRLELESV